MSTKSDQSCTECGIGFTGRSDKKFCSDQCRTAFNNRLRSVENDYIKGVNNILRKNRRILFDLNPSGKVKISREKMQVRGFDFNYFTSTYTTKEGALYYYCYDYGYLPIEKDHCLLVIKKDF
jgi:hypothetical protein